jgi:hypothetical protein
VLELSHAHEPRDLRVPRPEEALPKALEEKRLAVTGTSAKVIQYKIN